MKTFIILLLKNIGAAFLTKKMSIWGLKLLTSFTSNKIDDNVVVFVEAAANNDEQAMKEALEILVEIAREKYKK